MTKSVERRRRFFGPSDLWPLVLLGFGLGVGLQAGGRLLPPAVTAIGLALLLLAAGLWACRLGPRMDEMWLAGAQWAWLWGGFAGIVIGAGLAQWAFVTAAGLHWPATLREHGTFAAGILLVLGIQALAYLAFLALWWRRRGGGA
ncbi:MAG: hypothetical protein KGQ52_09230 [Alphaproteobacteria bacterium]|nr:hypothetical protein [Alphaproteobacteria bacterium]